MKPLSLLLTGLLAAAVFNFGLDVYQQARFRAVLPALAQIRPLGSSDQAFDQQLAGSDDPAQLRRMARTQHVKHREDYRLLAAVVASTNRINGVATVRSGTLLVLAVGALVFAVRAPAGGQATPHASKLPPTFGGRNR